MKNGKYALRWWDCSYCWQVVPVMRSTIVVHLAMSALPGAGMYTQRFKAYLLNAPGAIRQR